MKKAYIPDTYEQEQQILSIENGSHALILQSLKDQVERLKDEINIKNNQIDELSKLVTVATPIKMNGKTVGRIGRIDDMLIE
jgi:hypothetical protein